MQITTLEIKLKNPFYQCLSLIIHRPCRINTLQLTVHHTVPFFYLLISYCWQSYVCSLKVYLPKPLDLLAGSRVILINGASMPVLNINLLHSTQQNLQSRSTQLTSTTRNPQHWHTSQPISMHVSSQTECQEDQQSASKQHTSINIKHQTCININNNKLDCLWSQVMC